MRKLMTGVIAGLGLAAVMVSSASAANYGQESDSYLRQSPLSVVISQGDNTQQAAGGSAAKAQPSADRSRSEPGPREENTPWLYRSPHGVVISPGSNTQAAETR